MSTHANQRNDRIAHRFAPGHSGSAVNDLPSQNLSRSPWNPYWHVFGLIRDRYLGAWQRVLDLDCGNGLATVRLAQLGFDVWGIDPDPRHIASAAKLAQSQEMAGRCRFQKMAGENLAFPPDTFDIVVGIEILRRVDLARTIAEVERVLRPGAVAVFMDQVSAPMPTPVRNTSVASVKARRRYGRSPLKPGQARMLDSCDLQLLQARFARVIDERFTVLSRIEHLLPGCDQRTRQYIGQLDQRFLHACSPLARLGATAVLTCYKKDNA